MGLFDWGNTFDALANVFGINGSGEYYGSAIGGAIGGVAFSPFGPWATAAGAIIGSQAGGIIGSAFDHPYAGLLNCEEVVPLIIGPPLSKPSSGCRN